MTRRDVRIIDLYTGRIRAEFRDVERDEAVRMVRAVLRPHLRDRDTGEWTGCARAGWVVQAAVKVKDDDGRWRWVGPKSARAMGVFPKQEAA